MGEDSLNKSPGRPGESSPGYNRCAPDNKDIMHTDTSFMSKNNQQILKHKILLQFLKQTAMAVPKDERQWDPMQNPFKLSKIDI